MISAIVAVDLSGLIAYENRIPWKKKEDLKRFRELTTGGIVVMGRKTYDTIGKPLPNRTNVVITRDPSKMTNVHQDLNVRTNLVETLSELENKADKPVWVIGGSEIYEQAIASGFVNQIDLTIINEVWKPEDSSQRDDEKSVYMCPIPFAYSPVDEMINPNDPTLLHRRYEYRVW